MTNVFVIFWIVLIVASIAWYGFLVFYIGIKAGREITSLTKSLAHPSVKHEAANASPPDRAAR